ncbi:MAG: AgmX/PglI C-terminal domain-containing protein [Bdellovibrionaceae bacterium]|nr:AgmX/PglI C-terminal domain-containing protein [Bdellovibrionales bacterium]MCB9083578.1 AgmX/PglI C-terminal domain-containing protein [Pseudobdellovibrionaceae bacterium]
MSAAEKKYEFPVYVLISHGDEVIFERTFDALPVTIGRSSHCDITLSQFNWISRQHAVIIPEGGRIYLVDLKSSNGIQLGGRTYDRVEVHNGTIASIGPLVLQFGLPLERRAQARGAVSQVDHPPPVDVSPGPPPDDDKTIVTYQPPGPPAQAKKGRFYPDLNQENLDQENSDPTPDQFQFVPVNTATGIKHEPPMPPRGGAHQNPEATIVDRGPALSASENQAASYQPNFQLTDPQAHAHPQVPTGPLPGNIDHQTPKAPSKPLPYYLREEIRPPAEASKQKRTQREAAKPAYQKGEGLTGFVLERDRAFDGIDRVPRGRRVLEAYVTWKGEVLDTHLFWPGEQVVVGRSKEGLYVPTLKGEFLVADFDGAVARCSIPQKVNGFLRTGDYRPVPLEDLIRSQALSRKGNNYVLKLGSSDLCSMNLGHDIHLYFRYAPAPRQLSRKKIVEPDALLKKTITGSGLIHFLLVMVCLLFAPKDDTPKVKNLPPRIAKLLVKKEKPKPKPKPKKKKEEPKPTAKKKEVKPPPKKVAKQRKPKKVVVRKNVKVREMNKKVTKNVTSDKPIKGKPTQDVTKVGALAALGALGAATPNPTNQPVSINVNKNAGGGGAKMTTSGVIGAIKAKGGQLQAAGIAGVKTTGKGFGTGDGYGVQGIKGRAGSRGVAGSVVGTPSLMKINRTEGLNRKQVMDVVKGYLGEIQQCYERSLLTDPGIAGRVEYEWFITPQGQVKWAKVKKSDMRGGDSLNGCVLAIFKKMKFPVAKNGEATTPNIGFPFGRL